MKFADLIHCPLFTNESEPAFGTITYVPDYETLESMGQSYIEHDGKVVDSIEWIDTSPNHILITYGEGEEVSSRTLDVTAELELDMVHYKRMAIRIATVETAEVTA